LWSKIKILIKIEILVKNKNFEQQIEILPETSNFRQKLKF